MHDILGLASAEARAELLEASEEDVRIINALANPPLVPVAAGDIYVRRCRLASDAVDCGFGRFRTEFLPELLGMTGGAPLLVGHRKDTAGIARFFGGEIETLEDVYNPFTARREKISYIVPKFYWLRSTSGAEDLRLNIDGGIYSQVSISWWYGRPTCGVCGRDMRTCEHVPGRTYKGELAFYYYDDVQEVLEGSVVYAGGQPNTGFYLNAERKRGISECGRIYAGGEYFTLGEEDGFSGAAAERGSIVLEEGARGKTLLIGPEHGGIPLLLRVRYARFRGRPCRLGSFRPAV